jgi:UDPglucose 6-dehydrogenase
VGDAVQRRLERLRPDLRITVVSNPEFLREGAAIEDFMKPDRIVVGAASAYGRWVMERVYAPLMAQGAPMLVTRRRSAELVKYASNAFLATKISFINEMADLCEALGGDVEDVARGMGLDRRIGADFLQAGPGYGGSCFPKDTLALLAAAADYRVELRVVSGVVEANRVRVSRLSARVAEALGGDLRGRRVAVLGLTFKPHTDDLRDSPAVALAAQLAADGARVTAYDPQGSGPGAERLGGVELAPDAYACLEGAEAAVLATHWPEFADLDFARAGELMAERLWIDLRNAAPTEALVAAGFTVRPLGRPLAAPDADADPPHDAVPHPASLGAWTPSPSRSNPREIA